MQINFIIMQTDEYGIAYSKRYSRESSALKKFQTLRNQALDTNHKCEITLKKQVINTKFQWGVDVTKINETIIKSFGWAL